MGRSSTALTTPMRAYKRLATNNDTKNVMAVAMPENTPRKPATSASVEKLAETAVLKGNEMEKYKMEKSTEPTAMSLNIDEART